MPLKYKMKQFKPVEDAGLSQRGEQYPLMADVRCKGDDLELYLFNKSLNRDLGKMDLFTVLRDHIRPGVGLIPIEKSRYALVELDGKQPFKRIASTKARGAKLLYLSVSSTDEELNTLNMRKAWHFLKSQYFVEFHIKIPRDVWHADNKKEARRTGVAFAKSQETLGQFDWKNEDNLAKVNLQPVNMLHLRPDVILKAMPKKASFAVTPVANFEEYIFAIAPPGKKEEDRVHKLIQTVDEEPGAYDRRKAQKAETTAKLKARRLHKLKHPGTGRKIIFGDVRIRKLEVDDARKAKGSKFGRSFDSVLRPLKGS